MIPPILGKILRGRNLWGVIFSIDLMREVREGLTQYIHTQVHPHCYGNMPKGHNSQREDLPVPKAGKKIEEQNK